MRLGLDACCTFVRGAGTSCTVVFVEGTMVYCRVFEGASSIMANSEVSSYHIVVLPCSNSRF
jgi:hypothetical protein